MEKIASVYTDGACSGNPGPGGWGVVVYFENGTCYELGGHEAATTNNRMEMRAAIDALEFFHQSGQTHQCVIYTDSEYLIKGITQWVKGWKNKGWKTSAGKAVLNQDLWETLDRLNYQVSQQTKSKMVKWEHVKGHSGNIGNERCDTIARTFASGKQPQLSQPTIKTAIPTPIVNQQTLSIMINKESMIEEHHSHDSSEHLPREVRISQLNDLIETLRITDEIAKNSFLITSAELAALMNVNPSAVTGRGETWAWRNWVVSRVRREGNQILWLLDRAN